MEKKEEVKVEVPPPALRLRILVITIITALIFMPINLFYFGRVGTSSMALAGRIGAPIFPPWGFVFAWMIVTGFLAVKVSSKFRFSPQEMAILLAVIWLTMDTPFLVEVWAGAIYATSYFERLYVLWKYTPEFWSPKNFDVVKGAYVGGAPVPWGALAGPISFWMLQSILFLLTQLFTITILRKKFIDVERLPYPNVVPVAETIRYATTSSSLPAIFSFRRMKWFYIGFIVGFLAAVPATANYIWPGLFPVFFVWGQFLLVGVRDFFYALNLNIEMGWPMFIPTDMIMFYLAPLDLTATTVLWLVIGLILYPAGFTAAGFIPPGIKYGLVGWGPPAIFRPSHFAYYGVLPGIGLWTIIFSWRYIRDSLRNALKKVAVSKGEIPDLWMWAGYAITWLLFIALWSATGMPAPLAIYGCILFALFFVGYTYSVGCSGQWFGWGYYTFGSRALWAGGVTLGYFPTNPTPTTASWATQSFVFANCHINDQMSFQGWAQMSCYKLADLTKTSPIDMFKTIFIALLITAIAAFPIAMAMHYSMGITTYLFGGNWFSKTGRFVWDWQRLGTEVAFPAWDATAWGNSILGFIVPGVIMALRLRFPWFFIHPVPFTFYSNMWLVNSVPAFILKWLTLKIGGAKGYNEVGVPIAVGFLVGLSFFAIIGLLAWASRSI